MQHIIDRIAQYADIDTRRALGFMPRKLPPNDMVFPLGRIRWCRDDSLNANIVFVSFEDAGIEWHKIVYAIGDDQYELDSCVWNFNDRKREYKMKHEKDGSYIVCTKGYEDYWPNIDDWAKGRRLQRYKTMCGLYMTITHGYHPDWTPLS
jgi:hypothetical protein